MVRTVPLHHAADQRLNTLVNDDIQRFGVSAATAAISAEQISRLSELVDAALEEDVRCYPSDREIDVGRVVFLARYGLDFVDLLESSELIGPCNHILSDNCTLYTMTTICQPPRWKGRSQHVDSEDFVPGFVASLGVIVLLDDFILETGPTRFYPDLTMSEPSPSEFEAKSLRLEAPAGSACWFHGNLWHDALPNQTDEWRRAILIVMTRPPIRQRFDMPKMLAHLDPEGFTPNIKRKLGFNLIPPGSYDEYFLADEIRGSEILKRAVR